MARQRFIWPDLWDDPALGRLSPLATLLYIGCFSLADDDGRIIGEPEFLKANIFKYRHVTASKVAQHRDEVAGACGHFRVYSVDNTTYIAFTNWSEWQKPKYPKPSKLPAPPGVKARRKASRLSQKSSGNGSGKASESLGEASGTGLGRVGFNPPTPLQHGWPAGFKPCPHCSNMAFRNQSELDDHLAAEHRESVSA